MRTSGASRYFAAGIVAAGAIGAWVEAAGAACNVDIWARKLSTPERGIARQSDFRVNDQFVVCIRLPEDGYVSLWDVPPRGPSVSRLFPNVLTHKQANATVRAEKLKGGRDYCYGTPDTFPLFFPADQGLGEGKFSVHLTKSLDDQPTLEDYEVPGQRILRARLDSVVGQSDADSVCGRKATTYFTYKVSK